MKAYILILKFLFIGSLFIISNENLHLKDPTERTIFYENFYSWISNLFSHVAQITGYVVNSGWLPKEGRPPFNQANGIFSNKT